MQDRICRIDENLLHRAAGPPALAMSGLPPKADFMVVMADVRSGPDSDISHAIRSPHQPGVELKSGSQCRLPWRLED